MCVSEEHVRQPHTARSYEVASVQSFSTRQLELVYSVLPTHMPVYGVSVCQCGSSGGLSLSGGHHRSRQRFQTLCFFTLSTVHLDQEGNRVKKDCDVLAGFGTCVGSFS